MAGFDLRGHGQNPGNPEIASFGVGGWTAAIEDIHDFSDHLRQRFPEVPHYMLGFSLGSFLLREYLGKYPDGTAGAIIAGTGHEPSWLLSILMTLVKGEIKKSGFDGTTALIKQLSFGTYNQNFKPNRTEADWLCADAESLDHYLADSLVRKNISSGLFWELLGSMKRTGKADKGIAALQAMLQKAGLKSVKCKFCPNSRHDIFHEESTGNAEAVRQCVVA